MDIFRVLEKLAKYTGHAAQAVQGYRSAVLVNDFHKRMEAIRTNQRLYDYLCWKYKNHSLLIRADMVYPVAIFPIAEPIRVTSYSTAGTAERKLLALSGEGVVTLSVV